MNKRTLRITSSGLIVAAAYLLIRLAYVGTGPAQRSAAFVGLPVGRSVPIRFQLGEEVFDRFTDLEKRNQVRDWLMYTVMSEAGMETATLRKALYDVPPLRAHYLEPVAHFDYGETRSRSLGDGEIVAVVPKTSAAMRADQLADIADREYKNTGEMPKRVHVFEYDLDRESQSAHITQIESIPGRDLFQPAYGYVEAAIRSQADLAAFMQSVHELIAARTEGGVLHLAGRKRLGTPYRGLRLEDAAALWQSQREVQSANARVAAFEDKWKNTTYRTEFEKAQLETKYQRELAELKASMPSSGMKDGLVKHSGFSLDPTFDYDALKDLFHKLEPYLRKTSAGSEAIDNADAALNDRTEAPFLKLLYDLEQSAVSDERELGRYAERRLEDAQFQHARYDGPLRGTEVGMVLFYTDLLAKLWAMDYMETTPSRQVEDFMPLLKIEVSPIYDKEMQDLSNTRLWFGPQDDGFQKTDHAILFAPKATRVYAASSNTLKPGEEAEPNAASAAFLGWWDNHYDDVARYEPEYQRLNEIMKWSLLLSWLGEQREMDCLHFLGAVPVSHKAWFPVWARNNPNLKFRFWERISFFPPGYKGVDTESLPMLHSRWFAQTRGKHSISGGVSLGSEDLLAARPMIPKEVDPLLRRSNLNYSASEFGKEAFQTFDKTLYEFRTSVDSGRYLVSAAAKSGAKLRDVESELRNATFEYGYRSKGSGLAVDLRNGNVEIGQFTIEKRSDGFLAAFKGRDIEHANRLGRVVEHASNKGEDVVQALARQPDVESAVKLPDGYLIHPQGAGPRWIRISPEGVPQANISAEAQMRFASMGGSDSRLNIAWVSDRDAAGALEHSDFIVIHPSAKGVPEGVAMEVTNKGPPPTLGSPVEIEVNYGNFRVKGQQYGKDGPVYVSRRTLPSDVANDPSLLGKPMFSGEKSDPRIFTRAQDGDYRAGAERLADSPADFQKEFAKYRQRTIREIDDMLQNGRQQEAMRQIDAALDAFGRDPELAIRRATLARAKDLSERLARAPGLKAETRFVADHGTLKIEVRLLELKRSAVPAVEARQSEAVYVASDRVSLGTIDPSVMIDGSAHQVISDDAIVSKLVNWEIAKARPDVIEDVRLARRYELRSSAEQPARQASFGGSLRIPDYQPMSQDPCSSEEARRKRTDCHQEVYLVDDPNRVLKAEVRPR